jgi:hypothetical protein
MKHSESICSEISRLMQEGNLSNIDLVQIIEHCGLYLNLATEHFFAKPERALTMTGIYNFINGKDERI